MTLLSYLLYSLVNLSAFANNVAIPAGSEQVTTATQPNALLNFLPFILMFGVIYFLIIRPQNNKMKETQAMVASLKPNDEIITSSGIIGKIIEVIDDIIILEVENKVRFKMKKNHVAQLNKKTTT